MLNRSHFLIALGLVLLSISIAKAADENLKLVTATGRAAILSDENSQETRNRALEDALYNAALLGGAKIDGFSSVQASTELDDHFVVRPSSKILDYDILNEQFDDISYTVSIEAAVGDMPKTRCQNRSVNNVTMFAPNFSVDEQVPAWISQIPASLIKDLYKKLEKKSNVKISNEANVRLDPIELNRDQRFDYKALTSGVTAISDGDFAFSTTITLNKVVQESGAQADHFIDAQIESSLFLDSDYKNMKLLKNRARVKIQKVFPIKFMGALISPNQTKVREDFLNLISDHSIQLTEAMLCSPLSATMVAKDDGLHVSVGSRQGLENNRLAIVSNKTVPWTVLRVVKTNTNTALLKPLNRRRSLKQLNGIPVSFLEFD
ncbi:flagellar assembly protein T N-terminal domain-containing protein [Candidatus Puniceispirillum sp.]|nr:flagellar assembly protein T N-terminal domain-containing protein [Candidatus Puniceispirillum sp.]